MKKSSVIALALSLLAVSACGADGSGSADNGGSSAASTPVGATAASTGGTAAKDLGPRGSLTFAYYILPTSFDPHLSLNGYDVLGLNLVYDRLVHLSPKGEATPGLASSWEFSADGLSLDFTIRDDVQFHDGTPLSAEAVKRSLDRARTLEGSTAASRLEAISEIEVIDTSLVRLHLTEPAAYLPLVLSDRPGMIISPAAIDDEQNLSAHPAGTGMYTLASLREGESAVFEANTTYWEPEAVGLERIEFRVVPDLTTAMNGLLSGEFDVAPVDPPDVQRAEQGGLVVVGGPTVITQGILLNRTVPPLDNVLVRQALSHAIDREAIVDSLFYGFATPTGQLFLEGSPAYDPDLGPDPYPYDPERARELLAEAGYPDGFSIKLMASTLIIHSALATIVQEQLAKIGVDVEIQILPGEQVSEAQAKQAVEMALSFAGNVDPSIVLDDYFSDTGFANPGRHTTPALVAALEAASTPGDDRDAALRSASDIISDEALMVSIAAADFMYAVSPNVSGWQHYTSSKPEFRGVTVSE